jgi:hypothetical protein
MDLQQLEKTYSVPLSRFGKYVVLEERGKRLQVVIEVGNQFFDVGMPGDKDDEEDRQMLSFIRIMLCQALNVAHVLESEGIDTSEIPETDFKGAILGKFYRGPPK